MAPANADFTGFGALIGELTRRYDKPIAVVIYGGEAGGRWTVDLEGTSVPVFRTTRTAGRALALLVEASL